MPILQPRAVEPLDCDATRHRGDYRPVSELWAIPSPDQDLHHSSITQPKRKGDRNV